MRVSTLPNKIKRNISYIDFIRNDKGELVLKDRSLLTRIKLPNLNSYSLNGIS